MFNQINEINPECGDYIILEDFGIEGIAVMGQYDSVSEAIENSGSWNPQTIVKMVRFDVSVRE